MVDDEVGTNVDWHGGEWTDGGGGASKRSWRGGVELMESFVVWRVVVDLLLDFL